jgi:hypothetical protein
MDPNADAAPEHPEPEGPGKPALAEDLESRLEDDFGTLHGAPPRRALPPPPRYNLFGRLIRNLLYTAVLAVLPASAALATTLGLWVASGVPAIQLARGELLAEEARYHQALHHSQPVLDELEAQGAPADQVQVVYFAFADARDGDEARRLADTYLGVLSDQAAASRLRHGEAMRLPELLGPSNQARRRAGAAYEAWTEHLASPRGRLARGLGMVAAPTPGMAVYERRHPREAP